MAITLAEEDKRQQNRRHDEYDHPDKAIRAVLVNGELADGESRENNKIDAVNPLSVSVGGPIIPAGTQNNISFQDTTVARNGGTSTNDTVVTSGEDYYIEEFQGSGDTSDGKVELYFGAPAANEVGMTFIGSVHIGVDSEFIKIKEQVTGDGTAVLRIKFTNNDTQDADMHGRILGFDVA